LAATAITSIMAGCFFMGITVARVADQELGLLMLWMLPVCVTTPAGVSTPSRVALAMPDFNMKQQRSRAIPHNGRIFSSWLPSRRPVLAYCCVSHLYKRLSIRRSTRQRGAAGCQTFSRRLTHISHINHGNGDAIQDITHLIR